MKKRKLLYLNIHQTYFANLYDQLSGENKHISDGHIGMIRTVTTIFHLITSEHVLGTGDCKALP